MMVMKHNELEQALKLIHQQRYTEARRLLRRNRQHPAAQRWLAYLDEIAPPTLEDIDTMLRRQITETRELHVDHLRSEIGGTSRQLGDLNAAIEQAEARQQRIRILRRVGLLALPLLGLGLPVLAFAARSERQLRAEQDQLQQQRRVLLDDLEFKYTQIAAMRMPTTG